MGLLIGLLGLFAFVLLALALWLHSLPVVGCAIGLWACAVYLDKKYLPKELL